MVTPSVYMKWYENNVPNQKIENPIDLTLGGIEAFLADQDIDDKYKIAPSEFLRQLKLKNYASNLLAAFCALGAAFSSMAYFLLIRDHSLNINEWEFLFAPVIVGLFVAGATWYTYRHDTAQWMLDFRFAESKKIDSKEIDSKDIAVYMLTFLVVSMEIALSGYGVTELELGASQTALVSLVCLAALVPEWAQTHKYLDKSLTKWLQPALHKEPVLEAKQEYWLSFYKTCSVITLGFWAMAIFPLIEENSNAWLAAGAVAFYVLTGKPYMKGKAEEQVAAQFSTQKRNGIQDKWYPLARFGNGIGDLAFSSYGFFETLRAFGVMKENAKPLDTFKFCDGGDETIKTWLIIFSAVVVVGASCVGSFLMSANGDQESYGNMIARAEKNAVPYNKLTESTEEKPPPNVYFSSIWHQPADVPNNIDPFKKSTQSPKK